MLDQDLKIQKGFTLIELITVIVILSILAAIALPKFIALGQEARVASVNSLSGAVKSTANLWNSILFASSKKQSVKLPVGLTLLVIKEKQLRYRIYILKRAIILTAIKLIRLFTLTVLL